MKNIYELPEDEKNKLRDEFNKLSFAQKIKKTRMPFFCLMIITPIIIGVLTASELIAEGSFVDNICEDLFILSIIVFIIYTIYLHICFYRWMKVKHKIEY